MSRSLWKRMTLKDLTIVLLYQSKKKKFKTLFQPHQATRGLTPDPDLNHNNNLGPNSWLLTSIWNKTSNPNSGLVSQPQAQPRTVFQLWSQPRVDS